jgi:hypothetical protein
MKRSIGLFLAAMLVASCETPPKQELTPQKPFQPVKTTKAPGSSDLEKLAATDQQKLLEHALSKYKKRDVKDYTCTLLKQERIKGDLKKEQTIEVKFTPDPFRVAMHWTKNPPLADAILYVKGQWKDDDGESQLLARPASGFFQMLTGGSVLKDPDGEEAMKNTLRPVTQFGFVNSFESLIEVYRDAQTAGDLKQEYLGMMDYDGKSAMVLLRTLPEKPEYPAHLTYIFLEADSLLPVKVLAYGWETDANGEPRLLANYEFHGLKFNVGLTAKDFTPEANNIAPPK